MSLPIMNGMPISIQAEINSLDKQKGLIKNTIITGQCIRSAFHPITFKFDLHIPWIICWRWPWRGYGKRHDTRAAHIILVVILQYTWAIFYGLALTIKFTAYYSIAHVFGIINIIGLLGLKQSPTYSIIEIYKDGVGSIIVVADERRCVKHELI